MTNRLNQSHRKPVPASVDGSPARQPPLIPSASSAGAAQLRPDRPFDFRAYQETRMGLITVLLTMTYKVREISPSRESRMACDQVAELLAGDEAPLELEDELQISLPFEPRGGGTHTLCSACVPAKGGKAG